MTETWRPIEGYDGRYEVSDQGNVRSWSAKSKGKLMKPRTQRDGHLLVNLVKNGKYRTYQVHRLVMETFVGPLPPGMETRHLDGDPTNNRLGNLEYGTRLENFKDRVRHGTDGGPPAENRRKTHCDRGHEFIPENTRIRREGWRVCRSCQ